MTPAEILKAARAKIEKPENWCQGAMARFPDGEVATATDTRSCQWCSIGAVLATPATISVRDEVKQLLLKAAGKIDSRINIVPLYDVFDFNDTHTHPEVLQMFDLAIEKAENAEAT